MQIINNTKGVISIFLIIISLSIIVLAGIFIDFARIYFAENEVNKSIELSCDSTLTDYNQKLKGFYGLYAISNPNPNVIEENVLYYLTKNLFLDDTTKIEKYFDPYNYYIENLNIKLQNPLSEPDILEKQIVANSRYHSSKGLGNNGLVIYSSVQNAIEESLKTLDGLLTPSEEAQLESNPKSNIPVTDLLKAKDPLDSSNKLLKDFHKKNKVSELQEDWKDMNYQKSNLSSSMGSQSAFTKSVINDVYFDISKGNLSLYKEISAYFRKRINSDLDKYNNATNFIENSQANNQSTPESVTKLQNNKNSLLISEYLFSTFKNSRTDKSLNELDLNGYPMINRPSYFSNNADFEYILHGRNNSDENINFVKQQILFTRFMLNLISFNMDSTKINVANDIATGLNTKDQNELIRIRNYIILAWTLSESMIDVNLIIGDRQLPIIKDQDAWFINGTYDTLSDNILLELKKDFASFPVPKYDFNPHIKGEMLEQIRDIKNIQKYKIPMGYRDYIKMFAIMSDRSLLLLLTADMVQLNMQKLDSNRSFKLKEAYSSIEANTVVSIKYFFIGRYKIPEDNRIEGRKRKNIEVSIFRGY